MSFERYKICLSLIILRTAHFFLYFKIQCVVFSLNVGLRILKKCLYFALIFFVTSILKNVIVFFIVLDLLFLSIVLGYFSHIETSTIGFSLSRFLGVRCSFNGIVSANFNPLLMLSDIPFAGGLCNSFWVIYRSFLMTMVFIPSARCKRRSLWG